jgi:hypothetical protein
MQIKRIGLPPLAEVLAWTAVKSLALTALGGAIALLIGCDDSNVYTLYRTSPTIPQELHGEKARIHVATFDAAESGEYNRVNCEIAGGLFASQGVSVRYWCEKGRYRP